MQIADLEISFIPGRLLFVAWHDGNMRLQKLGSKLAGVGNLRSRPGNNFVLPFRSMQDGDGREMKDNDVCFDSLRNHALFDVRDVTLV